MNEQSFCSELSGINSSLLIHFQLPGKIHSQYVFAGRSCGLYYMIVYPRGLHSVRNAYKLQVELQLQESEAVAGTW